MKENDLALSLSKVSDIKDMTPGLFLSCYQSSIRGRLFSTLKKVFYIWHSGQLKKFTPEKNKEDFNFIVGLAGSNKKDPYISYFAAYLKFSEMLFNVNMSSSEKINRIDGNILESWAFGLDQDALRCVECCIKGIIISSEDREAARLYFDSAIKSGGYLIEYYGVDLGVFTFFTSTEISEILRDGNFILEREELIIDSKIKNKLCFVMSLDERFLKIYSPSIVSHMVGLSSYNFHFTICGSFASDKGHVDGFMRFIYSYEDFSGVNISDRISVSFLAVPDWVMEKKTMYACARFFSAKYMLEERAYEALYIMDADLSVTKNVDGFISSQMQFPMAFSFTRGVASIFPWRRYLAGNVLIKNSGQDLLGIVCDYLLIGLKSNNSWMLDQNALSYMMFYSCRSLEVGNNAVERKPFEQFPFRQMLEKSIRYIK